MKRLYFTVVALLSMTMTFAGNEEGMKAGKNGANATAVATVANSDAANYEIRYNVRRLGETLGLNQWQMDSVEALNAMFNADLTAVAGAEKSVRKEMLGDAIAKDHAYMSHVLTPAQLGKYETLINTTFANRGIEK